MADTTDATPTVVTPKAAPKCPCVDGYCQNCGSFTEANA